MKTLNTLVELLIVRGDEEDPDVTKVWVDVYYENVEGVDTWDSRDDYEGWEELELLGIYADEYKKAPLSDVTLTDEEWEEVKEEVMKELLEDKDYI